MDHFVRRSLATVPSARQLAWQALELTAFVHYGVNSFADREWGTGEESPWMFDPKALDTDQWCAALARAEMKGVILTAKHHDGFCLWDTAQTDHSVMHSPYGKDILAQLAASCRKYGLKLGAYLSPWDRHEPRYGQGKAYDDFFCAQLTELLTGYGELYCLWFDGACGEGKNGKVQIYDWERYYALIRDLQPGAVISVCGPDVRWCGNEAGHCRDSEWSVVAASMADNERIQHASQTQADEAFRRRRIPSDQRDLGSREVLRDAGDLIWYPAEVNTSIRPGWFYHADEDDRLRPLDELVSIYHRSVGGNAMLLLNVPPHPDGYIAQPDVRRLGELGDYIRGTFAQDLLADAAFFVADGGAAIDIDAVRAISPRHLVLMEDIERSQRVEAFVLEAQVDGGWRAVAQGTTVGYKRIAALDGPVTARRWRLRIPACRGDAILKKIALYG